MLFADRDQQQGAAAFPSAADKDFDDVFDYVKECTEGRGMKTKYAVEGDEVVVSLT